MSLVPLPQTLPPFLERYLPSPVSIRPFVTLTWAQSLDAKIAAQPGQQTKISHAETKTMTHYLRSKHDGILVGVGTVLADDPKLNCRYDDNHPRPIIVDPHGKWDYSNSTLRQIVDEGRGLAPYIITSTKTKSNSDDIFTLAQQKGKIIQVDLDGDKFEWNLILSELFKLDIKSVMIEGGATVINDLLLADQLVDSVIVTIGPVFLGERGVGVSPLGKVELKNVGWWTGSSDSIVAGNI